MILVPSKRIFGYDSQFTHCRLTDEFEQIDANDVPGFETFLHKYRNVIHSGHYLRLSALHSLSQLYGKAADYLIHEMPERELLRKVEICRELMTAFDVIEPGYSRLRGEWTSN